MHFLPRTPLKLPPHYSSSECYTDNENEETIKLHFHLMHGPLINEHNMSLGLISLVVLFSRLSGMEKCIVIRIVDKFSLATIVS